MTWNNTYDIGTEVTYYASDMLPGGDVPAQCRARIAAGPLNRWEYSVGATGLALLGNDDSPHTALVRIGYGSCVVPVRPDGVETGTPVRVETDQETYYGEIMANVAEGPDTFERAVLEERGFQVLADDHEIFADA